jgi:pimeloyl-ACP methyl ester carboxylesterase
MIAISLYDPFPKFPKIKCPTLVLFGEQDVLKEKEKEILKGIKGGKSVILRDAGHVPQMDQPEAFLKEVNQFLRP